MSLLLDILGGAMKGLGTGMVIEDERKQKYLEQKRLWAEQERQYQRGRKDKIADETRALGREVDYYDKDYTAKTVTPVFKDGTRGATRPMTQDEMMAWRKSEKNLEYQDAVMENMRRGGSGGTASDRPVTVTSDSLLARMGFQSKQDLYDSGDPDAINRYETLVGTKLPGSEWQDIAGRLQLIAQRGRQADAVLNAEEQGGLYFYEGAAGQLTPQEISARERQRLAAEKARKDRIEREREARQ